MKQVSSQERSQYLTLRANASKAIASRRPPRIRHRVSRCPHLVAGGSQVKDASGGPAGDQTFEKLNKQVFMGTPDKFMFEGGCDLPRGTRGKTHPQPAFKVAHLAAGGIAF